MTPDYLIAVLALFTNAAVMALGFHKIAIKNERRLTRIETHLGFVPGDH